MEKKNFFLVPHFASEHVLEGGLGGHRGGGAVGGGLVWVGGGRMRVFSKVVTQVLPLLQGEVRLLFHVVEGWVRIEGPPLVLVGRGEGGRSARLLVGGSLKRVGSISSKHGSEKVHGCSRSFHFVWGGVGFFTLPERKKWVLRRTILAQGWWWPCHAFLLTPPHTSPASATGSDGDGRR